MDNVINNKGEELNAHFNIEVIDNQLGLILESRNGLKRNWDYNTALQIILKRLQEANIDEVTIKVVSNILLKNMPNFSDRTIKLNEKAGITLRNKDTNQLRKKIGNAVANLKIDKIKKGGNPTKRIGSIWYQLFH